jgi:hypothetical protein
MSLKKRLLLLELVATGQLTLAEARAKRTEVLQQTRRGRLLLRIERAERAMHHDDHRAPPRAARDLQTKTPFGV